MNDIASLRPIDARHSNSLSSLNPLGHYYTLHYITSVVIDMMSGLDWPLCHCAVVQAPPFDEHRRPLAPSKFFDK